MFGYLNECRFIGRLGADPESRTTQGDDRVVNFRIAVSETWKDKKTGEKRERTEWVSVVIWNQAIGNVAMNHLKKGTRVYIGGRMQTRKWQDQNGNDRYTTEVVLPQYGGDLQILDSRDKDSSNQQHNTQEQSSGSGQSYASQSAGFSRELDSDVPF